MTGRLDVQIKEIAERRLTGYISGVLETGFGVIHQSLRGFRIRFALRQMGKRV